MKSRGQKKYENPFKIVVYALSFLATIAYIVYRFMFTMPFNLNAIDIVFGIIVIFVELVEVVEFGVYFWHILRVKQYVPEMPEMKKEDFPEVDVFIATYNEGEDVLEKTLAACAKMKYPDPRKVHIYLCDDGNRVELKELTDKYGATLVTRELNRFAKAGNYNHALRVSKSPYIAIFDADMRPTADFLLKTIPFFNEEKMGFVQTPQSFKNPDIFQAKLSRETPFEQDYFYHYIQIARNRTNSVIMCGTNCVLSREALKKAGGFAQATIAEDVATGMLMEAKGYRGIAIDEVLAYGENINSVGAFLKQRSRWGRGCIQTAKAYGIFRIKGLKLGQKLDYFVAINYWCFGLKRMLYMLLPLLFAFFGIIAIQGDLLTISIIFFTQYLLKRFVIDWLERGYKSSTWSKIYEIIQAPYMAMVILGELIGISIKKFSVTPKGAANKKAKRSIKLLICHLVLLGLNAAGIVVAAMRAQDAGIYLYVIPIVWMGINSFYLLFALLFDIRGSRNYKAFRPNSVKHYGFKSYFGLFKRGA